METDPICSKMLDMNILANPPTHQLTEKIQQCYELLLQRASMLSDQQIKKISTSADVIVSTLYECDTLAFENTSVDEIREPVNKNIDHQLRFYSSKKSMKKKEEATLKKTYKSCKKFNKGRLERRCRIILKY